jgi:hypothetical protein
MSLELTSCESLPEKGMAPGLAPTPSLGGSACERVVELRAESDATVQSVANTLLILFVARNGPLWGLLASIRDAVLLRPADAFSLRR